MRSEGQLSRIKNRRKRYLDLHPEYFHNSELELANPLLYDRLIRRHQTPQEREIELRAKGYTGSLEADLVRSEARLAELRDRSFPNGGAAADDEDDDKNDDGNERIRYRLREDGSIVEAETYRDGDEEGEEAARGEDEGKERKEEAWERWVQVMGRRFLAGEDGEFDYASVDGKEEYDDHAEEERREIERYVDGEEEEFVGSGSPKGETGVQDY